MLDALEIDYLGVSLRRPAGRRAAEVAPAIKQVVGSAGVAMKEIGYVEEGAAESVLKVDGRIRDFSPRFRESAYTPRKKGRGRDKRDFEEMRPGLRVRRRQRSRRKSGCSPGSGLREQIGCILVEHCTLFCGFWRGSRRDCEGV